MARNSEGSGRIAGNFKQIDKEKWMKESEWLKESEWKRNI